MALDIIVTHIVKFYKTIDCILRLGKIDYRYVVLNSFLALLALFLIMLSSKNKKAMKTKIMDNEKMQYKVLFITLSIILALSLIGIYSSIIIFGTDIGEHSLDALHVYMYGHWNRSFKNPYYDLVNVPALLRVFLCITLGISSLHSVISACTISLFANLCFVLTLYEFTKKVLDKRSPLLFLLTYVIAISNPYVYKLFISSHYMGCSFLLSMLSLMVLLFHSNTYKNMVLYSVLYLGSLLIHGTALLFIPLFLSCVVYIKKKRKLFNISLYLSPVIILIVLKIVYTTAYRGFLPYLSEIIGFLTQGLRGEIELREVRWNSPEIPRATAISFSLLPALALCQPIMKLFQLFTARFDTALRDVRENSLGIANRPYYVKIFLVTAIVLSILSFLCSFFSNSLNRELGVPAMGFLAFSTIYVTNIIWSKGIVFRLILLFLAMLAFTANWATPLTIPWYKDYTSITIAWRTAFYKYYLQSFNIMRFYDFVTPITIYTRDKVCLEYVSMMLYSINVPRNLIKVYSLQVFSGRDTNIIYNSIDLLVNIL